MDRLLSVYVLLKLIPHHFLCLKRAGTLLHIPGRLSSPPKTALVRFTKRVDCNTLSNMKTATLSIRLDADLDQLLGKVSRQIGRSRSEVARDALRRQLRLTQFEAVRRRMMPFAEARGFLTDEDVFSDQS